MEDYLAGLLQLRFRTVLVPIPEEDGGGWEANIPELGSGLFCGGGDSAVEAIFDLNQIKKEVFERWYSEGKPIPMPKSVTRPTV